MFLRGAPNQFTFDVPAANLPNGLFRAGYAQDRDNDGLSDGYETLVSQTIIDLADTDRDGIPDGWEVGYGLDPIERADGTNVDSNGLSNLQKYLSEQQRLRPSEPLGPCSRRTPLVISEIMYNPLAGQNEFIEIYNSHHLAQDISGFQVEVPGDQTFVHTLPANTILQPQALMTVTLTDRLDNGGGRIRFRSSANAVLLDVEYDDDAPWPVQADGAGHSLVLTRPSYGENDPHAWAAGGVHAILIRDLRVLAVMHDESGQSELGPWMPIPDPPVSVIGIVLGTMTFSIVNQGIFFSGLDPNFGSIIIGALLLTAVLSNDSFRAMALRYAAKKK